MESEEELIARLKQADLESRAALVERLKQNVAQPQTNFAPIFSWADSELGTNLSKSYQAPMTAEESAMMIAKLRPEEMTQYQKEQLALAKDQNKLDWYKARKEKKDSIAPLQLDEETRAFYKLHGLKDAELANIESSMPAEKGLLRANLLVKQRALSDKQVQQLSDYQKAIGDLETNVAMLGENQWTGEVTGRVPGLFIEADEAAFRAATGRFGDAYRKLISGTAVSDQERRYLEDNIPNIKEDELKFKEKAVNFIREYKKVVRDHLSNIEKQGKAVKPFIQASGLDVLDEEEERAQLLKELGE